MLRVCQCTVEQNAQHNSKRSCRCVELYTRGIGTSRGSIYKERNTPSRRVLRFMHHFYSTNYTYIIYHLFITFLAFRRNK